MSDNTRKLKDNVPGKYYVGAECIGCSLCSEIAPDNFASDWNENLETEHNYVCKQPENAQEEDLCAEAAESCPANAIGTS
jgi:ferredoxin